MNEANMNLKSFIEKHKLFRQTNATNCQKVTHIRIMAIAAFTIFTFLLSAAAYEFPIRRNLPNVDSRLKQQQVNSILGPNINRRSDDDTKMNSNANDNEVHQLRQVVDSVTQMLNEEDRIRNGDTTDQQDALRSPQLMSEAAIRQAIEELEVVQQQERQQAAAGNLLSQESKQRPSFATPNEQSAGKQSSIESLLNELGDELTSDQLAVATQEAERILKNDNSDQQKASPDAKPNGIDQIQSQIDSQSSSSTVSRNSRQIATHSLRPSPLAGQMNSDLGETLTNDFYSFHADPIVSDRAQTSPVIEPANLGSKRKSPNDRQDSLNHNDLESAAQTRSAIVQREPQAISFNQNIANGQKFDFAQPSNTPEVQQRPPPSQATQVLDQDALVRAFRQQTGANIGDNQFPASTLIPFDNPGNFWRPSSSQSGGVEGEELVQPFNQPQQLPNSRFQSLSGANSRSSNPHIHFTGHSFVSANNNNQQQFPSPQRPSNQNARQFSSTNSPIISVLSGLDTGGSGGVNWNPPTNINPPPSQLQPKPQIFSQPFPSITSTQPSSVVESGPTSGEGLSNQFFSSINQGPPSPLFRGAFQLGPEAEPPKPQINFRPSPNTLNNNFVSTTQASFKPEVTTDRFIQPSTTTQWSPSASSQSSTEKEMSDSQPRSSIRSLPNGQRFFSPNDLVSPTSTLKPFSTEQPRSTTSNSLAETTTLGVTSPPLVSSPPTTTNTTAKKEDMVIYYYYYYDDNKNATVVAKNVTSGASTNPAALDAAIEADGGVEDTPYMDDPAPANNLPQPKPISTSVPSTTLSTPPVSDFRSGPNIDSGSRLRTNSIGSPVFSEPPLSANFNLGLPRNERPQLISSSRPAILPSRSSIQEATTPFTPNISTVRATSRSTGPIPERQPTSRISSTEVPLTRTQPPTRLDTVGNSISNPTSSLRLPTQAIQNALNGTPNQRISSTSTAPTPTSSTTTTSRVPLSNASRYGTNNNIVLDPYGLDPSGPAGLAHTADSNGHHHNQRTQNVPAAGQRKPTQSVEQLPPQNGEDVPRNPNQFSSQRSQNTQSTPNLQTQQVGGRVNQNQPNIQTQVSPARQQFPEVSTSSINEHSSRTLIPAKPPSPKQNQPEIVPIAPRVQPQRQLSATPIESSRTQLVDTQDVPRNQPTRTQGNGRPLTNEGNTSNGFTRAPPLQALADNPSPPTILRQQPIQRVQPAIPVSSERNFIGNELTSTQPSMSTSISRSFTMSQPTQASSAVTQPSSTSTSVTTTVTQSTSSTTSSAPISTESSSSPSSPEREMDTTTQAAPTTESSESNGSASTRRRFGNRNNRFQTRLSAAAGRTSTTSTTTPPPQSSTTRRPTTSTTRKSSRQLFAGRRKMSSPMSEVPTVAQQSPQSMNSTETTPISTSSPIRSRFGGNLASRVRSTTTAPDQSTPSSRPSLFGAQRATFKPRPSFLKNNKPSSSTTQSENTVSTEDPSILSSSETSAPEISGSTISTIQLDRSATDKLTSTPNETPNENTSDAPTSSPMIETDAISEKEPNSQPSIDNSVITDSSSSIASPSSSTSSESVSGRNKPRVRPLFASRQRNSSLFGNRRSNSTATA